LRVLLVLTGIAALLRLGTLGDQSLWVDEELTKLSSQSDFGSFLRDLVDVESNPPLYPLVSWVWAHVAGTSEFALRLPSAIAGTALVPASFYALAEVLNVRGRLFLAALVAVNPFLIWYSQEARAYSLVTLLTTLSLLFFLRALRGYERRTIMWWAGTSVLALLTHYFALFIVLPEGLYLCLRARGAARRDAVFATGGTALVLLALAPLAAAQRAHGGVGHITSDPVWGRVESGAREFMVGAYGTTVRGMTVATLALFAVGGILLVLRAESRERRNIAPVALVAFTALVVPVALAVVNLDYFTVRGFLIGWPPLFALSVAGMSARRAGLFGGVAFAGLSLLFAYSSAVVARQEVLQRDDWRDASRELGAPRPDRAILLSPGAWMPYFRAYRPRLVPLRSDAVTSIDEMDVLVMNRFAAAEPIRPPAPRFTEVSRHQAPTYTLVRFRAPAAIKVRPGGVLHEPLPGEWPNGHSAFGVER
jgi:hypothetical protein